MSQVRRVGGEGVVHVLLDRPERGNALDRSLTQELIDLMAEPSISEAILVFRGAAAGNFVAGADVAELRSRTVQDNLRLLNARLFDLIERHPRPTVAVVDGPALGGGCEFALSCDFRIGTERAVWGLPEVQLGLVPAAGGLHRLERLVGRGVALDLILTGRRIIGSDAERLGLCQRYCSADEVDAVLSELLARLGRASRLAQQLAKRASLANAGDSRAVDAMAQALCVSDADTQVRLDAFLRGARSS